MRPHFRLRTLLVLTALVAAACYWWAARPTIVARRFAATLNRRQNIAADTMCVGPKQPYLAATADAYSNASDWHWQATVMPRTWHDFCASKRQISLQFVCASSPGFRKELFEPVPFPPATATARGVELGADMPNGSHMPRIYAL